MSELTPAELEAAMIEINGDPADWRDELRCHARAEHLAALACEAADAGLALIERRDQRRRVSPDDPQVGAFGGAILGLQRGMQQYVRKTGRGNGAEIIYTAVALRLGAFGANWIADSMERLRELLWQRVRGTINVERPADANT